MSGERNLVFQQPYLKDFFYFKIFVSCASGPC